MKYTLKGDESEYIEFARDKFDCQEKISDTLFLIQYRNEQKRVWCEKNGQTQIYRDFE